MQKTITVFGKAMSYVDVDGAKWVRVADVLKYLGYIVNDKTGAVPTLNSNSGVARFKGFQPQMFDVDNKVYLCLRVSSITEVAKYSTKDNAMVVASRLKTEIESKIGVEEPRQEDADQMEKCILNRPHRKDYKMKIKSLSVNPAGECKVVYETGEIVHPTLKKQSQSKCAHLCEVSGEVIQPFADHYLMRDYRKGYGNYRISCSVLTNTPAAVHTPRTIANKHKLVTAHRMNGHEMNVSFDNGEECRVRYKLVTVPNMPVTCAISGQTIHSGVEHYFFKKLGTGYSNYRISKEYVQEGRPDVEIGSVWWKRIFGL